MGHKLGNRTIEIWRRTYEDQISARSARLGDLLKIATEDELKRAVAGITNAPHTPDHHLSMVLQPMDDVRFLNVRLTEQS